MDVLHATGSADADRLPRVVAFFVAMARLRTQRALRRSRRAVSLPLCLGIGLLLSAVLFGGVA